ncbi:MAG: ABC transporter permease [Rhodospirillales bacterium]|nr:ABC transporter permease [Rhodospirillales bacterium]MDP6645217.1 ABC transporter permease [Rhodospirillales bacterium]MDP6840396.1 ABC transporter permease [Rhodospirillales bacterium]
MSVSLPHAVSVWRRNASLYRRTWKVNLLPNFFEPVFYLTAIGIGVGAYITEMGGVTYVEFLVPGLICVSAMHGASFEVTYNVYVRLVYEKTYSGMVTTPVTPDDILVGEVLWALTRSCIYGGGFFIVAALFGLMPGLSALLAIFVIPLTGLMFAAIGIAVTLRMPTIELFSFYFTLFLTPLFLFSDVFFPISERLSGVWLQVAEILPLLHPVRLARSAFSGEVGWLALWDAGYIVVLSAGLLSWAKLTMRKRLSS